MNISLLVLLYDISLAESPSLNSLLQVNKDEDIHANLYIWNNGPLLLEQEDIERFSKKANTLGYKVIIYEDIRNLALSKIYNFFLKKKNYDFCCILDHDSILPKDFLDNILKYKSCDLIVPFIQEIETKENRYPRQVKVTNGLEKIISVVEKESFISADEVMSIGSGLTLSSNLTGLFWEKNQAVFDEHFVLYGVDSMFFRSLWRLHGKGYNIKTVCAGHIIHSSSFFKDETSTIKEKRKIELLYDMALVLLHHFGKKRYWVWKTFFKRYRKRELTLKELVKLTNCIISKAHPRAKISIKEHFAQIK